MKTQGKEWEKIFSEHLSDKELILRIYKEKLQLNYIKTNSSINIINFNVIKNGKIFEQTLHQTRYRMGIKHTKICSISPINLEMQIKTIISTQ